MPRNNNNDIRHIDTPSEAAAYGIKKGFALIKDAMNSTKKLLRLVVIILSCALAAVIVKYTLVLFK